MARSTVTIDKGYFEDLLRRAHLDSGGVDFTTPINLPTVTIPSADYDALLRARGHYIKLERALLQGGMSAETLEILINAESDGEGWPETSSNNSNGNSHSYGKSVSQQSKSSPIRSRNGNSSRSPEPLSHITNRHSPQRSIEGNGAFLTSTGPSESDYEADEPSKQHAFFGNNRDARSLVLANLPPSTSPKEVTAALCGGQILDLYFRPGRDLNANIAFVEGSAAKAFLEHVRRHDLYINGRRIDVSWNDRQFILQGHIAHKVINHGASRNLCIAPIGHITADKIRADLEHIHNLIVVDIYFEGDTAFVSLNSVMSAITARDCLSSRFEYKGGTKIRFTTDECSRPLPTPKLRPRPPQTKGPVKKTSMVSLNRFQALGLVSNGSDSDTSEFTATTFGGGVAIN